MRKHCPYLLAPLSWLTLDEGCRICLHLQAHGRDETIDEEGPRCNRSNLCGGTSYLSSLSWLTPLSAESCYLGLSIMPVIKQIIIQTLNSGVKTYKTVNWGNKDVMAALELVDEDEVCSFILLL